MRTSSCALPESSAESDSQNRRRFFEKYSGPGSLEDAFTAAAMVGRATVGTVAWSGSFALSASAADCPQPTTSVAKTKGRSDIYPKGKVPRKSVPREFSEIGVISRAMRNASSLAILPFLAPFAWIYACGGDSKPPTTPDTTTSATAAASSAMPMTSTTASAASSTPIAPPKDDYTLPVAAAKFSPDKAAKGWKPIEIKDDGSVMRMNKVYMKFVKNALQDDTGKAFFTVTKDGAVAMGDKPYGKFDDKDSLVITDGGTIMVGDDGAVKLLEHDGKP